MAQANYSQTCRNCGSRGYSVNRKCECPRCGTLLTGKKESPPWAKKGNQK